MTLIPATTAHWRGMALQLAFFFLPLFAACTRGTLFRLAVLAVCTLVLYYNVLVKMNMFRTRCMLFYFAKTIEFVS
jgi:hypothetical protein